MSGKYDGENRRRKFQLSNIQFTGGDLLRLTTILGSVFAAYYGLSGKVDGVSTKVDILSTSYFDFKSTATDWEKKQSDRINKIEDKIQHLEDTKKDKHS